MGTTAVPWLKPIGYGRSAAETPYTDELKLAHVTEELVAHW
jgi:hypothetical protein